jgi:hypothetical protein
MPTTEDLTLYPGNDWEPEVALTKKNSSGAWVAATGLTDVTMHISLTYGGAAIHADLTKTMTERADTEGLYYAVIEGGDITTHLAPLAPLVVYRVIANGGDIKGSKALSVVAVRPL